MFVKCLVKCLLNVLHASNVEDNLHTSQNLPQNDGGWQGAVYEPGTIETITARPGSLPGHQEKKTNKFLLYKLTL